MAEAAHHPTVRSKKINGQTIEVRVRNLEAHAFRTDCRLRDLEALVAEPTGTNEPSPGGQHQRLDRLER
ncbi:hypothetical protein GCM10023107_94910 [Actinoplanes octamycinicus]|nr:hypothetical protein Aoc01nite_22480 [Actinoplanes octamycinicus]